MTIRMKDKVDIYLANPGHFNDDLREQYGLWVRNVVRPLGSHYEASKTQIDGLTRIANQRSREHAASLARIDMYIGIVTSVLFFAVDIIAAGAMSRVTMLSRQRSTQSFDDILASSSSLEAAIRTFHSQTSSISDSIVANFDSSVRGLVSTGTIRTVGATINSLSASIGQSIPSHSTVLSGPLTFQNQLSTFYDDIRRKINEQFVFFVRDSTGPESEKRAIIERFVHLPFVMPPTLSLESFDTISAYFEVCYWVELINSHAGNSGPNSIIGGGGPSDYHLPYTINDRLLALTGHYITNVGGAEGSGANVRREEGGMVFFRAPGPSQYSWRGWCSRVQATYANSIMLPAARNRLLTPYFISQGISSQNAFS